LIALRPNVEAKRAPRAPGDDTHDEAKKGNAVELKYVRHSEIGFILWPRTDDLWHAHIGQLLSKQCQGTIVSAGFAKLAGGKAKCWGERSERPFAPRWRDRRKARARQLFRCLKARIDAMASKLAPNVVVTGKPPCGAA
jgi:hypothetical protein